MKTVLTVVFGLVLTVTVLGQNVVQIEYFIDTDAGFGKNKLVNVTPSADSTFAFNVDLTGATVGFHALYIRTRDSNGQWSHTSRRTVEVLKNPGNTSNVVRIEYVFDTDPGVGKGTSVALAALQPDGTFTFVIPKDNTTPGVHTLYVRAQDSPERNWSLSQWKAMTIVNCTPPDQPPAVASQTVCAGSSISFTVGAVAQATGYRWTVPSGWTIESGQGTTTVRLKAPVVTSVTTFTALSVAAYNACDTGQVRLVQAIVNPLPGRPSISVSGDTALVSNVVSNNQWFLNGTLINGATGRSYRPLASGQYTVQVSQNGCVSPPSEAYPFIITATSEPENDGVQVFPNPVSDHMMIVNKSGRLISLNLYSITGQQLLSIEHIAETYRINTASLAAGYYILLIRQGSTTRRKVILK